MMKNSIDSNVSVGIEPKSSPFRSFSWTSRSKKHKSIEQQKLGSDVLISNKFFHTYLSYFFF